MSALGHKRTSRAANLHSHRFLGARKPTLSFYLKLTRQNYSITLSARASSVDGTVTPRALAMLKDLMTNFISLAFHALFPSGCKTK